MSLEINQDLRFQERMWRIEQVARLALTALLLAALLGLFGGGGWLSRRRAATPQGSVQIDYQAIERRGAQAIIRVRLAAETSEFWIETAYLEKAHLTVIQPEPQDSDLFQGRTRFRYPTSDGLSTLRLEFQPRAMGPVRGRIGSGEDSVEIRQWILP